MFDYNSDKMMASYFTAGSVFAANAVMNRPADVPVEGSTALTKADYSKMAQYAVVGGVGATAGGMIAGSAFSAGTAGAGLAGGLVGSAVGEHLVPASSNRWVKASAAGVSAGVVTYLVAGML